MKRVLPAARSVVYEAFCDPSELAKWRGPEGFTAPSLEFDPRVGESYRIEMQPPEGDSFYLNGDPRRPNQARTHFRSRVVASVSAAESHVPARDENQPSTGTKSASTALLPPWKAAVTLPLSRSMHLSSAITADLPPAA